MDLGPSEGECAWETLQEQVTDKALQQASSSNGNVSANSQPSAAQLEPMAGSL